jgi:glutamate/tyrosine decarboxylase-like PLP-dependent enzyme
VHVVIGEEAHATILSALRLLGLGEARALRVPADDQGRMIPAALERDARSALRPYPHRGPGRERQHRGL